MQKWFRLIMLSILTLALWGCSTPVPAAPPTPTRTPVPTIQAIAQAPTATPKPTATRMPSPTPTEIASEAAPTPFPPDVNPLTGLKVDDEALLDRIPLAIKVSNSPEARPQSGLSMADIVFEHFAVWGYTRFTGVFYSQDPGIVGSVRSSRLIDLEIPAMYGTVLGYSGSSAGVKDRIRNSDLFPDYIVSPDFGVGAPTFYRVPQQGKAFEHTLFCDPQALLKLADERGLNKRPDYARLMTFTEEAPTGGESIDYLEIYFQASFFTQWQFDETGSTWRRSMGGVPHTDALTGKQITADNVIIVFAHHIETDIVEDSTGGRREMSIEIQVWGTGPAIIFRDGQMYSGYWERWERNHMLTFNDGNQGSIPLKPGNTWIELVPLDTVSNEIGDNRLHFEP